MYGRRYQRKRGFKRVVVTLLSLVMLVSVCFQGLEASARDIELTPAAKDYEEQLRQLQEGQDPEDQNAYITDLDELSEAVFKARTTGEITAEDYEQLSKLIEAAYPVSVAGAVVLTQDQPDSKETSQPSDDHAQTDQDSDPDLTEDAGDTVEPGTIEETEKTVEPDTVEEPEKTVEPDPIEEPEKTVEPSTVDGPEKTVEPSTVDEPEKTVEPSTVDEPEKTVEPSTVEEPEKTVESGTVEEPEKTVEPSTVDESDNTVEPGTVVENEVTVAAAAPEEDKAGRNTTTFALEADVPTLFDSSDLTIMQGETGYYTWDNNFAGIVNYFQVINSNGEVDSSITITRDGNVLTIVVSDSTTPGTYTIQYKYRTNGSWNKITDFTVTAKPTGPVILTFDPNIAYGGSGSPYTMEANENGTFTFPDPTEIGIVPQEGYMFAGWSQDPDGPDSTTDYSYQPNLEPRSDDLATSNKTYYATWISVNSEGSEGTYSVTFYVRLDGAIPYEPSSYAASAYTSGIQINDALRTFVNVNNNLEAVAANLAKQPTDDQLAAVLKEKGIDYNPETQTVIWYVIKLQSGGYHVDGVLAQKDLYWVTYYPNGGSTNVPAAKQYAVDKSVEIDFNFIPTRSGYTFLGWDENPDATMPAYTTDGQTFSMPAKNVDLYAIWRPNNNTLYYIDYYLVEPDGTASIQTSETVTKYGTTNATATVTNADIKTFANYQYDATYKDAVLEGVIDPDTPLHLELYYVRAAASLKVTKSFEGIDESQYPDVVKVTVTGEDDSFSQELELSSENEYTQTISAGLYSGYSYKVVETDCESITNYELSTTYTGLTDGKVMLSSAETKEVTVLNTYTRKVADITVTKELTGNMRDTSKTFPFTVTLSNATMENATVAADTVTGSVGYTVSNGDNGTVISFNLGDKQKVIIKNVPIGADVVIVETPDGYTPSSVLVADQSDSEIAQQGDATFAINNLSADTEVAYTNYKNLDSPDTGISTDFIPYILLFTVAAIGAGVLLLNKCRYTGNF